MRDRTGVAVLAALLVAGASAAAYAEIAVSANDAKLKLVNGKSEVQKSPPPDTVTFIDLRATPPKVLAEIEVPNSVTGPPTNVAVSPKEDIALVASSMQIDPADPTKQIPDDRLTVIDLSPLKPSLVSRLRNVVGAGAKGEPPKPKIVATLQAGKGASGVSINKAGTLALVANKAEGTVSVFTIAGTTVTPAGKVTVGKPDSRPSHVVFTPDGKRALVTREGDYRTVVLSVDGTTVEPTTREITSGLRPNAIDVASTGDVAVVANVGISGSGDASTISVIDLKLEPPRVVNSYSVGVTPEGIKMSPDGKFVAVTVMNGTNRAPGTPFYNDNGLLQVWARNGTQLTKAGELPIGKWCQGVVWANNGKTLLVQCMVEEEIIVVRFSGLSGKSLQKSGSIKIKGGPAGIRTAEP
jgi:DNA-binding beta-propeller fold protein YncE